MLNKAPEPDLNDVKVAFNLHKKTFSIRHVQIKLPVDYAHYLLLKSCTFEVSKKGQERVRKTKQKNVHAFIRGSLHSAFLSDDPKALKYDDTRTLVLSLGYEEITYNPYKHETFVHAENQKPIQSAEAIMCFDKKCYAKGIVYR